jgi:hypothetical protein
MSSQPIPVTHLMRTDFTIPCGEHDPDKLLLWPWPLTILDNPQLWPEISLCPACQEKRLQPGCRSTGMRKAA